MLKKTGIKNVINAWSKFIKTYRAFRKDNGLTGKRYDGFEICTSLSDKHGRICRQVKHTERNDQKMDWPDGMTEAIAGYIIYIEMLLERYGCDMSNGWENELESALNQYRNKKGSDKENDLYDMADDIDDINLGV